jgi:hypothetical protein
VKSGPNEGTTSESITNSSGETQFTYTSSKIGTDHILASFTDTHGTQHQSNEASETWEEPQAVIGEGIVVSPTSATNKIGEPHTLTATVQNELGEPIEGAKVQFDVKSGPNEGTTSESITNSSGETQFTYTSSKIGTDHILASFTDTHGTQHQSNEASETWERSQASEEPAKPPTATIEVPPPTSVNQVGTAFSLTAIVSEGGVRLSGVPVTFVVTGVNPRSAVVSTNASGEATFSYTGEHTGTDHIVASFVDRTGRTDVSDEVTKVWTQAKGEVLAFKLPAPVLGKTVNVEVVSGTVFVKLPSGTPMSLAAPLSSAFESLAKGAGFIPLTEARQISVGSTLDTTLGVARLTTATQSANKVQTGNFSTGIFTILQNRKQRGLTDLKIVNSVGVPNVCATLGKRAGVAARHLSSKVLGRLTGDAHGKFTTQGEFSAATVRGTIWNVRNQCDGTLTQVTRGVVSVRDFVRRKTITLFTGQSYLAKAP